MPIHKLFVRIHGMDPLTLDIFQKILTHVNKEHFFCVLNVNAGFKLYQAVSLTTWWRYYLNH